MVTIDWTGIPEELRQLAERDFTSNKVDAFLKWVESEAFNYKNIYRLLSYKVQPEVGHIVSYLIVTPTERWVPFKSPLLSFHTKGTHIAYFFWPEVPSVVDKYLIWAVTNILPIVRKHNQEFRDSEVLEELESTLLHLFARQPLPEALELISHLPLVIDGSMTKSQFRYRTFETLLEWTLEPDKILEVAKIIHDDIMSTLDKELKDKKLIAYCLAIGRNLNKIPMDVLYPLLVFILNQEGLVYNHGLLSTDNIYLVYRALSKYGTSLELDTYLKMLLSGEPHIPTRQASLSVLESFAERAEGLGLKTVFDDLVVRSNNEFAEGKAREDVLEEKRKDLLSALLIDSD